MNNLRIGIGYDVHRFTKNRDLIIGGEIIPFACGLAGHSDADVLVHAVIDSLLGAADKGDIGRLFPDIDKKYKDISSIKLLAQVNEILAADGVTIINIDSVVICEEPKISPYIDKMRKNISLALGNLAADRIGIKGKTTEGLGFAGREEGIAAQAVSLICLKE